LDASGEAGQRIGAFFFVSITGLASPSIQGLLMNRLPLNPNIKRVPIFGSVASEKLRT
jgi:alkylresorcinol/alkylpyrone synthase